MREALSAPLLKLAFLLLELLLEGDATAPLLLQIDLGAPRLAWVGPILASTLTLTFHPHPNTYPDHSPSPGAGLPLWRHRFGRLEESRLAGPQPLLSALYTLLADFLSGNLRKHGLQASQRCV